MSLQETLDAIKKESAEKLSDHAIEVNQRFTEKLAGSGQAEEAIGEGDQMPHFSLPDTEGDTVTSAELLERGPLVVTFYRGVW